MQAQRPARAAARRGGGGVRLPPPRRAAQRQARWMPREPLRWPNDRVMRVGIRKVCQPWEVPNDYDEVLGDYGIVTAAGGYLSSKQMDNMMLQLKRLPHRHEFQMTLRDEFQLWPVMMKMQDARQGGGLPDPKMYEFKLRQGTVLVDIWCKYPRWVTAAFMKRMCIPGQMLLGVRTVIARRGIVDLLDDYDYHSATGYMDGNYFRRHQDVMPGEEWRKHYLSCQQYLPDHPLHAKMKQSQRWYPYFEGKEAAQNENHLVKFLSR